MQTRTVISALVAATLGLSSMSSFAQGNDRRAHNREEILQQQRQADRWDDRRDERRDDRQDARRDRRDDRRDDRQDARRFQQHPHYHYNARGPEFRRGGYVPREYRHRQYVVVDYRSHRLAPPPRGHQWVQVGGDYVLIAIATGIIASIILSQ